MRVREAWIRASAWWPRPRRAGSRRPASSGRSARRRCRGIGRRNAPRRRRPRRRSGSRSWPCSKGPRDRCPTCSCLWTCASTSSSSPPVGIALLALLERPSGPPPHLFLLWECASTSSSPSVGIALLALLAGPRDRRPTCSCSGRGPRRRSRRAPPAAASSRCPQGPPLSSLLSAIPPCLRFPVVRLID